MYLSLPGRGILVIDDDPAMAEFIARVLARAGWPVFGTDEPQTALEIVERENIGAAVIGVFMPVMNGPDLAEKIRDSHPQMPVVFVTGRPEAAERFGLSDPVVSKPFTQTTLVEAVARVLGRGRAPAPEPKS